MRTKKVVVTGEHALMRVFVRAWLKQFEGLQVVAESNNGHHTHSMVQKYKPALVLMDFDTLLDSSVEMLTKMRHEFPKVKVIIYFAHTHKNFAIKAIRAGAVGYVLKSANSEDMDIAIRTVMSGGVYLSADFLKTVGTVALRDGVLDKHGKLLSERQAEIFRLFALGLSTKAIAFELKISAKTVDVHKQALMARLGTTTIVGLAKYAIKHGLVPA
jgi:DNA-binding NarL/FixJ family response regulator